MTALPRRHALALAVGSPAALALPLFAIGQTETCPSIIPWRAAQSIVMDFQSGNRGGIRS
ncbi:hypothetical protein BHK69_18765 [Bosea vaviloviae]|uniref:Uncharacterized protein n=1 Tax=Bosea vaviloviae TaxID=1526658 RepID=A0A1D7U4A8_9HYPH|nr:hypothetical protein BHK69_18765 [Bosea vaviloviae]